ncbi:MAG: methyltransferase domain-containing protein [Polyangiales bacterium]|nr:methyltransferase domain-containing protein [Myxococcales bacterium]MCB9656717.1 methyltransferase domain-containing protein [Sandaracinaceae bacterium]
MYSQDFYERRQVAKEMAAELVLDRLLPVVPTVRTAVDVGCGVGTWLAALEARGVDVTGFDGPWVDARRLRIDADRFRRADLVQPLPLMRRCDLAISLEVAEHLPETAALTFVDNLTRLSDVVLFSAAIPGQGGTGHVNEQWPDYWAVRFDAKGYALADVLRTPLWNDERIPYWYRQNTFVYVARSALPRVAPALRDAITQGPQLPLRAVHPCLFDEKRRGFSGLVGDRLRETRRAVMQTLEARWDAAT